MKQTTQNGSYQDRQVSFAACLALGIVSTKTGNRETARKQAERDAVESVRSRFPDVRKFTPKQIERLVKAWDEPKTSSSFGACFLLGQACTQTKGIEKRIDVVKKHGRISRKTEQILRNCLKRNPSILEKVSRQRDITREAVDLDEPPPSIKTIIYRKLRDTAMTKELKKLHQNRCQICGLALPLGDSETYSEAHHIKPLGKHDGYDIKGNIIILCPNCHAQCDYGAIQLSLSKIRQVAGHSIDEQYVRYHNSKIFQGKQ